MRDGFVGASYSVRGCTCKSHEIVASLLPECSTSILFVLCTLRIPPLTLMCLPPLAKQDSAVVLYLEVEATCVMFNAIEVRLSAEMHKRTGCLKSLMSG